MIEVWKQQFNQVFEHHPNREQIMDRLLGDDFISTRQIDIWFGEADDFQRAS